MIKAKHRVGHTHEMRRLITDKLDCPANCPSPDITFPSGSNYRVFVHWEYGEESRTSSEVFMCISTQMLGFGMAGFFTRLLVEPAAMIWP